MPKKINKRKQKHFECTTSPMWDYCRNSLVEDFDHSLEKATNIVENYRNGSFTTENGNYIDMCCEEWIKGTME